MGLSDSSGDDESNTSPQHTQDGICSSSLLTSTEPNSTDDSSDGNGGNSNCIDGSVSSDKGTCGTNLTGDGSSAPVSPLDPTLIAGDGVEVEKSPKPVQVAVASNLDLCDDSLSDICKEPPKKKLALDAAATALLLKNEDRKKRDSNETQTDSGFSSKSENVKEKISVNNTSTEKTTKQSKTEQQNSETSSENQDMD